ncbi:type I restriction-modification system subunit M [Falsiroseomonas oryziterrae]|uniref:type I restriction-modification system subunit M n=1 Tax=Falsiroseomonas oryziterrae TaxID=2911368 RepID=UPI001F2DE7D3|nr:class I SAM-dependent DNA methyltransferase [Roseomonas sp. NPKOSM-4]
MIAADLARHSEQTALIWSIAEILRGDYKQSEYGRVVLPFVVLRRLDCLLEPKKADVLKAAVAIPAAADEAMREAILNRAAGHGFHNASKFTFALLKADPANIADNLRAYVNGFSPAVRDVFINRFEFGSQIARLDGANLLYLVVSRFAEVDLHPDRVSNLAMGYVFEELIRRFAEQSNETAGEHFTPREVIRLMVNLLLVEDTEALTQPGVIRSLYDPACGTGGMLSVAEEYLRELNPQARLVAFGQELNPESFAVCKSDLLIKGHDASNIAFGNSFTEDGHAGRTVDYCISNPPFGVEWKKVEQTIRDEHEKRGYGGRFGAGLPRVSDGSLLFVQHMISKFHKDGRPSRLAVVLNGSPLFTGAAGSGESEIRRWIIENDWLEAIVGLPDQLFYNTGISTYVWIITNQKRPERRGKVQLIDATAAFEKMRKSLGNKRNLIPEVATREITRLFGEMVEGETSKILRNEDLGYTRIRVERPLRLVFRINADRVATYQTHPAWVALKKRKWKATGAFEEQVYSLERRSAIERALHTAIGERCWLDQASFREHLQSVLAGVEMPKPMFDALVAAFSSVDERGAPIIDSDGNAISDPDLRDYENVPLTEDIAAYMAREVLPHAPDAWEDESDRRKGYEIPFTRLFYRYQPPRPLAEIDADLRRLSAEITEMLKEIAA